VVQSLAFKEERLENSDRNMAVTSDDDNCSLALLLCPLNKAKFDFFFSLAQFFPSVERFESFVDLTL
jgi:hypothetical protein